MTNEEYRNNYRGKIVYFLYPPQIIENEIIMFLIKNEYEVYSIKDHELLLELIKMEDSVVYINLDTMFKLSEWEDYIKSILENEETSNTLVGVLTFQDIPGFASKCMMKLGTKAGYIKMNQDKAYCKKTLLKLMVINEVKGRRQYLRIKCDNQSLASFNIHYGSKTFQGKIINISISGIACVFAEYEVCPFNEGDKFSNIQLRLMGSSIILKGILKAIRYDDKNLECVAVILFLNPTNIVIDKIHQFIYNMLNHNLNSKLNRIKKIHENK